MKPLLDGQIVTTAPCRQCGEDVEVTKAGYDALKSFSRILMQQGKRPLKDNECYLCDACANDRGRTKTQRSKDISARVMDAKRRLKAGNLMRHDERELERIIWRHHGDPQRWFTWLKEYRAREAQRPRTKGRQGTYD